MNSLFTQSPIEASLWTHFVSLQQWVTATFLNTAVFRMAVATWLGFLLMRCIWGMTADQTPALAARRFFTALITSMVGLSLLSTRAAQPFRRPLAYRPRASTPDSVPQRAAFSSTCSSTRRPMRSQGSSLNMWQAPLAMVGTREVR
jgi:hypothetical protein